MQRAALLLVIALIAAPGHGGAATLSYCGGRVTLTNVYPLPGGTTPLGEQITRYQVGFAAQQATPVTIRSNNTRLFDRFSGQTTVTPRGLIIVIGKLVGTANLDANEIYRTTTVACG